MMRATSRGLVAAAEGERRCRIQCIHNAMESAAAMLLEMWASKTAQEAHDILRKPDVTVTNAKDKEIQLPKILKIDHKVRQLALPPTPRLSASEAGLTANVLAAEHAASLPVALPVQLPVAMPVQLPVATAVPVAPTTLGLPAAPPPPTSSGPLPPDWQEASGPTGVYYCANTPPHLA